MKLAVREDLRSVGQPFLPRFAPKILRTSMSSATARTATADVPNRRAEELGYWFKLPICWAGQVIRNGHDILRVLDLTWLRPMPAGLVGLEHPWVTGVDPASGRLIWPQNVLYRTPRDRNLAGAPDDDAIAIANGRFLAGRVRQSAVLPELPQGPRRRMPHAINYMHGSSHYNSGAILFNDFEEGFRHLADPRFRAELRRFVRAERREVLFLFRRRDYDPLEYAYFSCCARSLFPWFCNPNGPGAKVLWGNFGPVPAANLITGAWARDVYALLRPPGRTAVVRPPITGGRYFAAGSYGAGRNAPRWPEAALALLTYWRVRLRGRKGGMFFVDRRKLYAEEILKAQRNGGDRPQADLTFW